MATPGELIEAVATVLGLQSSTVFQFDRLLAEAGLRSKGGRGTSAAKVTSRDAANLLIAIAAAPMKGPTITFAARTCETYGALPVLTDVHGTQSFRTFGLPSLDALPAEHSLGDALTALIEGASKGEAFQISVRGEKPVRDADGLFSIRFDSPRPWAEILADGTLGDHRRSKFARLVYWDRSRPSASRGDLRQYRHVGFATIRALGKLI